MVNSCYFCEKPTVVTVFIREEHESFNADVCDGCHELVLDAEMEDTPTNYWPHMREVFA